MKTPKYLFVLPLVVTTLRSIFVTGVYASLVFAIILGILGYDNKDLFYVSLSVGFQTTSIIFVCMEIGLMFYNTKHLGISPFVYETARFYLGWSDEYMLSLRGEFDDVYYDAVRGRFGASR